MHQSNFATVFFLLFLNLHFKNYEYVTNKMAKTGSKNALKFNLVTSKLNG